MPTLSMSAGKADIPASTTRQVSLQFSQRGFLPRRSYDSMPSKEVLMAENSIEWIDAYLKPSWQRHSASRRGEKVTRKTFYPAGEGAGDPSPRAHR